MAKDQALEPLPTDPSSPLPPKGQDVDIKMGQKDAPFGPLNQSTSHPLQVAPSQAPVDLPVTHKNSTREEISRQGSTITKALLSASAASVADGDPERKCSEAEITASGDSSTSYILSPILSESKRKAVDSLMAELRALLDRTLGTRSRVPGANPVNDSSSSSPARPSTDRQPLGDSDRHGKRKRDERDGSGNPDGDSGSEFKRIKLGTESGTVPPRKLACPYYRRNPQKHQKHRSCAGPGWVSVHRVK